MKIPSIRILSTGLEFLTEIDSFTSLEFRRSWQGIGGFQFVVPIDAQGVSALSVGKFIMLDNDDKRSGIIRNITFNDSGGAGRLTVTGDTLNGLASQRIAVPSNDLLNGGYDNVPALESGQDTPVPVSAETILKTYAERHMASPTDAKRALPITIAPDLERGMETVWMARYDNLDLVLQQVGEYTDMGWGIAITPDGLVFDVIPGVDHSANSSSPIIFASKFETVTSLTRSQGVTGYKNLGYAAGNGDGANRVVLKVTQEDAEPEGLDRQEVFLDCGTLEILESDTAMSLADEGKHQLTEYQRENTLTATVPPESSFPYRVAWDLGDLVTVMGGGASYDVRVSEIAERYEAGKYSVDVTFGTPPKHLGRVIQQIMDIPR